jgi:DNA (cytosine-5)-methyltransferase 1
MRIAGLFSGIGGLELPFHQRGFETSIMCDVWEPSKQVLAARFPDVEIHGDIASLRSLPSGVDLVTAGFPCTDLSQAGRTAGIEGSESSLVSHVFRLLKSRQVEWLVLENVRNMLVLDGGKAMRYLIDELEVLGFRWAYRLVDSRFAGVPQRRHRVLLVASRSHDPRRVLFADDEGEPASADRNSDAYGFYWTEGLRGLGWAQDAVPPLKGGSGLGIPSSPAVWVPGNELGQKVVTPSITDAEELQGFSRNWTDSAGEKASRGARWKLVGNAVTVGVADWLASRIVEPGDPIVPATQLISVPKWPKAASGENGTVWSYEASLWPIRREYKHLSAVMDLPRSAPLSHRATAGFLDRANRSSLTFDEDFLLDVKEHVEATRPD